MPQNPPNEGVSKHEERHQKDGDPCKGDQLQGLDGKAGDAIDGKGEHFFEWILAFACEAFVSFVGHHVALKAYEGRHATKEKIHFPKFGQCAQRAIAHQAIIGVVVGDVNAQSLHESIK